MSCSGILGKGHDEVSFTDVFNRLGGAIRHQNGCARSKAARRYGRVECPRAVPHLSGFQHRLNGRHAGRHIDGVCTECGGKAAPANRLISILQRGNQGRAIRRRARNIGLGDKVRHFTAKAVAEMGLQLRRRIALSLQDQPFEQAIHEPARLQW